MANNQMTFTLGINTTADLDGINKLKSALKDLNSSIADKDSFLSSERLGFDPKKINEASVAINTLNKALTVSFDSSLGGINFNKFQQSIKESGFSMQELQRRMAMVGSEGYTAFAKVTAEALKMNETVKYGNSLTEKLWNTFKNTVTYTAFNALINTVSKSISRAVTYVQDLDSSLNDIRIVSGQSAEQMADFAVQANEAAKALGSNTKSYTEAALIYYQQGLTGTEVTERTDVTTKMANVTGESAQQVSEDLTAIWNNFYDGSKSLEYYADVITALGAATASSTDEISEGLGKFAAIADTVGLSYEYATTALATVVAETRQSADTVGTAFKTLFARLQGLTLGETLDDGTDLNKYSQALAAVGISIKDQNGQLRNMDDILNDMGSKWQTLNKDQQVALAQTVAGTRQYTYLVSLMDKWETFQTNLNTATSAQGELNKQNNIYLESTEAHLKRLNTAAEDLYSSLFDNKTMNTWIDALTKGVEIIDNLVESMGGLNNIAPMLIAGGLNAFSGKVATSVSNFTANKQNASIGREQEYDKASYLADFRSTIGTDTNLDYTLTNQQLEQQVQFASDIYKYRSLMSKEEVTLFNNMLQTNAELVKQTSEMEEQQSLFLENNFVNKKDKKDIFGENGFDTSKIDNMASLLSEKFADFDNSISDITDDKVIAEQAEIWLKKWEKSFTEAGIDAEKIREEIGKIGQDDAHSGTTSLKEKIGNTVIEARQLSNAMSDVAVKTGMASEQAKSLNQNFEMRDKIQSYIQLAGGLLELMQSIKMVGSGLEIIKNDDLSVLEKATQLLSNLLVRFTLLKKALTSLGILDSFKAFEKTQAMNAKALTDAETKLYQAKRAYEEALKEFRLHEEKEIDDVKEYYAELNHKRELENVKKLLEAKLEALRKEKQARDAAYQSENFNAMNEDLSENDRAEISARLPGLKKDADMANQNYMLAQTLAVKNNEALAASEKRLTELREKGTVATYLEEHAQVRVNLANAKGAVVSAQNAAGEAADAVASMQATGAKKLLLKAQMSLNAAMKANPIGFIITAITALVGVLSLCKKWYDEVYWSAERANEEINKASEEYKTATSELENLNSKIEDINTSLEELRNNGPISLTDQAEINKLEAEKALLEAQLELQKQIQLQAAGETVSTLNEAFADNSYGLDTVQVNKQAIYGFEDYLSLQGNDNSDQANAVRNTVREITGNSSYSDEQIQSAIDSINSMMDANNINFTLLEDDVATRALFYEQLQNLVTDTDDEVQKQIIDALSYEWDSITNYGSDAYKDYFTKENYEAIQEGYDESQFVLENGTKGTSEYAEAEENIQNAQEWLLSYYKINGMFGSLIQNATDKSLSEEELDTLKNTIEDNNGEVNLNAIKEAIGEDNYTELEAYAEAYKISLEDLLSSIYAYDVQISEQTGEVVDELSNQLNSVKNAISETDSGINSLLSGEELDTEAIEKIENSLYGLTDQYAELIAIRDKNSDAYLERLISIREELDAQAISLAKNASASAYDILDNTPITKTNVLDPSMPEIRTEIEVDNFAEVEEALNDFLDADYEITVAVKADLENDFQTATSQMEEAANMAQKIGDDFIVAGQDLRELNQQFPGILDGITYLEDGTARLSQEAVEIAIANSKAEGAAAAQSAIEKIQAEQQVLLAKAAIYHQMGVIAQKGANNEELIEQSVSELKEQTSRIDAINNKEITQQKVENENEVADASAETGRAIVNNIGEAYRIAGQAADQFADEAVAALQSAITGEKVSVNSDYSMLNNYETYQRDTEEGSRIYETTGISSLEDVEKTDQLKALADAYFAMEEELKASANDMSGMIAELAAGVNTIDTNNKGGSGSSDKKSDKDFDGSLDRYWDINKALDKISDAMDELEKKQSKLHGKELINSLKVENKLLEEQAKQYQLLAEEQDKELSEINAELESYGFKFNDNKEMQNYLAQYQQILNDMDNATTLHNAGIMNEETYNNASKEYENVKNLISRYDELINKRRENQKDINENERKIKENNLQAWEVELEVKLDTREAERDWNDFFGEISEDFKSIYTDFGNNFRISMFDSTSLSNSVNDEIEAIKHVQKEIDKMKSGQDSSEYESISQAQAKLKELSEQMRDDAKEVFDLYKQGWEDYNSYIDEAVDKFDKLTNKFEKINEDLDHQAKLIELLYGQNDYDNLNNLYEVQKANLLGEMESLRDQANFFKNQYEELASVYGEDSDAAQKFKESWENAVNELHSQEEAYLETLANKYSNIIEKAFSSFEKQMAKGSSYDFISDQWDKSKEAAEGVFDEQERIYELQTLGNKYQKAIDKATSTSAQKKLTDLYESQVKSLEDKTRLTQYDIELAEKRLAVAEAEAALEDARNAKNTLKVTRGDDGNWAYQYVADDANVADKEQSLLDAQKEAYEYVKQNISDTKELMMTLAQDWSDTIKDLELKMIGATEEEKIQYQAMIDWYNEYYSTQMNIAGEDLKNHEKDLAVETNALLMAEYQVNTDNYNLMTENQKLIIDGLKDHMVQSTVDVYNATGETLDFIAEHGDEVMRETVDYFSTAASEITDAWANNPDSIKMAMEETLNECKIAMDEYTLSVKEGCISAGENFTEVGAAIDKDREAVNNLENATTDLINNTISELDLYGSYLEVLEGLWDNVKNAIDSNYDSIQDYLKEVDTAVKDTLDLIQVLDEAATLQYEIANGGNGTGRGSGISDLINNLLNKDKGPRYKVENAYGDTYGAWDTETGNWGFISGDQQAVLDWIMKQDPDYLKSISNSMGIGARASLYDTGGYTGSWSDGEPAADNGKLAFLHSKELVLNQDDTKNILSAVDMIRNLTDDVQNSIQQAIANNILKALTNLADLSSNNTTTNNTSNIDSSQQNIFNINAEFPNAENIADIQAAILGLPNAVSQYTGRKTD